MEKVREAFQSKLEKTGRFKDELISLFDFYEQYVFSSPIPGGCPLMNNAVEADDHHIFMKKAVSLEMRKTIDFIAGLLEKGRNSGEFKLDIKPKDLAYVFFCSIEGAVVISRVTSSPTAMNAVVTHCKNIVEQISL